MQNILRSISVCVTGFFLSCIIFLTFSKINGQGAALSVAMIFLLYIIFLIYSLVMENILLFLYKGNTVNAFWVAYSMLFIFLFFYCFYEKGYEQAINSISGSVFLILQVGGFYYYRKKKSL
ncbi:hypothetical protein [Chryseobacterium ginsengisoli]|uniref:hypothetical protein n=1 Tax=Chryseobacterium ginsengisoli TaxID=363853 RepID=UPI0031E690AC